MQMGSAGASFLRKRDGCSPMSPRPGGAQRCGLRVGPGSTLTDWLRVEETICSSDAEQMGDGSKAPVLEFSISCWKPSHWLETW